MKRSLEIIISIIILMLSAVSSYERMTAKDHLKLGDYYLGIPSFDKAIASFKKAIRLEPGYAESHIEIGVVFPVS